MNITLTFRDKLKCRRGEVPLYDILYVDDKGDVKDIFIKKRPDEPLTIESPILGEVTLNFLFWVKFWIHVKSQCPYYHVVERFPFENLYGGEYIDQAHSGF